MSSSTEHAVVKKAEKIIEPDSLKSGTNLGVGTIPIQHSK